MLPVFLNSGLLIMNALFKSPAVKKGIRIKSRKTKEKNSGYHNKILTTIECDQQVTSAKMKGYRRKITNQECSLLFI